MSQKIPENLTVITFDMVYMSAVVKSLKDIDINKPYIAITKKIYNKATGTICLYKGKLEIKLGRGIK